MLALRLMRMITCCCKQIDFAQRSGMLLRWFHLLRHILGASPATRVCYPIALIVLQG